MEWSSGTERFSTLLVCRLLFVCRSRPVRISVSAHFSLSLSLSLSLSIVCVCVLPSAHMLQAGLWENDGWWLISLFEFYSHFFTLFLFPRQAADKQSLLDTGTRARTHSVLVAVRATPVTAPHRTKALLTGDERCFQL